MKSLFRSLSYRHKINHHLWNDGSFGRLGFLFLFLAGFHLLTAQQSNPEEKARPTVVFVGKGVKIISADPSFNRQIANKTVVVHNATVSSITAHKKKYIALSSNASRNNLASQIKNAEKKKKHDLLRKVQKQIAKYEAAKRKFHSLDVKEFPSNTYFSKNNNSRHNYVVPYSNQYQLAKAVKANDELPLQKALSFLIVKHSAYYNSTSINHCYSEVFSVRPPPFLS